MSTSCLTVLTYLMIQYFFVRLIVVLTSISANYGAVDISSDVGRQKSIVEEKLEDDVENLLPEEELPWVVMVFRFDPSDRSRPSCFGLLVTAADVITTCSCVKEQEAQEGTLMVKPKTSIVEWDDDYKMVNQVLSHPHCEECSGLTYNNIALLTIDAMIIMKGLVEELHLAPQLTHSNLEQQYGDCYILGLVTGTSTPYLGSLEVKKVPFTAWKVPSSPNPVGSSTIFGNSSKIGDSFFLGGGQYPGSPLMCSHNPVALYLGVFCSNDVDVTVDFIKKNCSKPVDKCDDCVPVTEPYIRPTNAKICKYKYEVAMTFDAFHKWIAANTFKPADKPPIFHSRPDRDRSCTMTAQPPIAFIFLQFFLILTIF